MSQPLADDSQPHRPTRVQASLRRRAYQRGRGPGRPSPLDELDVVDEPTADDLEAEEQLEAVEAREEAEGLFDDDGTGQEIGDDDLVDVDDFDEVRDAEAEDEWDEDDVEPGGGHPEAYDELDLDDVVAEPEVETVDELDTLEVDPEVLDEDEITEVEDALLDDDVTDLEDDLDDGSTGAGGDGDERWQAEPQVAPVAPAADVPPRPAGSRRGSRKRYVPARRVRRTIRRVDPLSLGKLALVFNLCFLVMVLVAGIIIWSVASASGSIGDIEGFVEDIGFEDFELKGAQLLRGVAVGGLVIALAGAFFAFILGVLFNLLSDLVGGIRITMVEPDEQ